MFINLVKPQRWEYRRNSIGIILLCLGILKNHSNHESVKKLIEIKSKILGLSEKKLKKLTKICAKNNCIVDDKIIDAEIIECHIKKLNLKRIFL